MTDTTSTTPWWRDATYVVPAVVTMIVAWIVYRDGPHLWELGGWVDTIGAYFIWRQFKNAWEAHPDMQKAPWWMGISLFAGVAVITTLYDWVLNGGIGASVIPYVFVEAVVILGIWWGLHRLLSDAAHAHFAPAVIVGIGWMFAMSPFYLLVASGAGQMVEWSITAVFGGYGFYHWLVAFAPVENAAVHAAHDLSQALHHDDHKEDDSSKKS